VTEDTLTPFLVRFGYSQGVFPMGDELEQIGWYEPRIRAMFPMRGIRVSTSLAKRLRRVRVHWVDGDSEPGDGGYEVKFDTSFELVMRGCLRPGDNWITEEIIRVYTQIHFEGWAHCAEVWQDGQLVGGTYGLAMGSCFCAESMFHRVTDASKIALWSMIEQCRRLGFTMFDAQVMNPHLRSLGAFEMSQQEYLRNLKGAMLTKTAWS